MPPEHPAHLQPAPTPAMTPPGASPGDSELVAAILAKDRKAAAHFVAIHADAVYGYVGRRLAPRTDLVDDVVQDVFLAALDGLSGFRGTSSLRSWLLGIARHKVEDHYRASLRAPLSLVDENHDPPTEEPPVDVALDRSDAEARAQRVLDELPEAYRLVLRWRYWEHRRVREIAEATGRTEKSVERLLARARERFRTLWETAR